jgi:transposase
MKHGEGIAFLAEFGEVCIGLIRLTPERRHGYCGINRFTFMPPTPDPGAKRRSLQNTGTFNPRADQVRHSLFAQSDFFDPEDLLQLKYEMLRALERDSYSIAQAAQEFGLSRPTIYQAQAQFEQGGLPGLLPRKRGPKKPHKWTDPIATFIRQCLAQEPDLAAPELVVRVRDRFKIQLHRRTIEKALKGRAKKGPLKPA